MTAANDHLERWQRELDELRISQVRLTAGWDAALAGLHRAGLPPHGEFIDDLADYSRRWGSLARELSDDAAPVETIDDLSRICAAHAVTRQAVAVLDQVQGWVHTTDANFEPLLEVRREAAQLRETLLHRTAENAEAARALADGRHPFCELIRLQQSGKEIDDGEWDRLHDRVTERFGRAMAIAIGRGRIQPGATAGAIIDLEINGDSTSTSSSDEPDYVFDFASAGTRMTGVLDSAHDRLPSPPSESPTGAPLIAIAHPVPVQLSKSAADAPAKRDSGLLEAWELLREQRAAQLAPPSGSVAAALAEAALLAAGEERVRCQFRLLEQLLIDDQLPLAYHLANVGEAQSPQRLIPLPASLIRACL